jgi:hypothetical protein
MHEPKPGISRENRSRAAVENFHCNWLVTSSHAERHISWLGKLQLFHSIEHPKPVPFFMELFQRPGGWNQQAILSGELLRAMKHFSIFRVFTSEENIR